MTSRQSKYPFAIHVAVAVSVLVLAGGWMRARRFQERAMPPPIEQSRDEPIKYVGDRQTDKRYHHGGLRSAVGVHRYQAFRANREHPTESGSAVGWTYSHQPYLAYWKGKFYLQYLSKEKAEYLPPARTLILTSKDGRRWRGPEVVFPEYAMPAFRFKEPETGRAYDIPAGMKSVVHHRTGFYVTRDDRLLTFGFYSVCPLRGSDRTTPCARTPAAGSGKGLAASSARFTATGRTARSTSSATTGTRAGTRATRDTPSTAKAPTEVS
jgi:hypothetical protein